MKEPKKKVTAYCSHPSCQCERQGWYKEDIIDEYYDYYECHFEHASGFSHTFAVPKKETEHIKAIQTVVGTSAATILLYNGAKIYKGYLDDEASLEAKAEAAKEIMEAMANHGVTGKEAVEAASTMVDIEPYQFVELLSDAGAEALGLTADIIALFTNEVLTETPGIVIGGEVGTSLFSKVIDWLW